MRRIIKSAGWQLIGELPLDLAELVALTHRKCGRPSTKRLSDLARRVDHPGLGDGCAHCAEYGFDPAIPAHLYVIELANQGLVKVGIANVGTTRIEKHQRRGWNVIAVWRFNDGSLARQVEQSVIRHWKADWNASPVTAREVPSRDGHTECVRTSEVPTAATIAFTEVTCRELGGKQT